MTLLGSSKLAEKRVISKPFIMDPVKTFASNPNQLVENMNRQNGINNGKMIKSMRPKTEQSGGAFWLKHAEAISQSKSPLGVQLSTPKVTPKNTQNVVLVPQFPDNNYTPTSSTEIAKGIIKNQYEMHVQSSTDGGTTVQSLGNEQQSGGRRKKRKTSIRKKKSRVRKSRTMRMTRSRKRIRHTR